MNPTPNFDHLARIYRSLEHLTFGPLLARTRNHFLPQLRDRRQALVFGDGDGRFLARLLARNPSLRADAVDLSPGMLAELGRRCSSAAGRLRLHRIDVLHFLPQIDPDLVVTHFFLDCLTADQLAQLVARLVPRMAPGGFWVVSEFHIPQRGAARPFARLLIRVLYLAFRVVTGLRVTEIPDYPFVFERSGLVRIECHNRLFGILRSELWLRP